MHKNRPRSAALAASSLAGALQRAAVAFALLLVLVLALVLPALAGGKGAAESDSPGPFTEAWLELHYPPPADSPQELREAWGEWRKEMAATAVAAAARKRSQNRLDDAQDVLQDMLKWLTCEPVRKDAAVKFYEDPKMKEGPHRRGLFHNWAQDSIEPRARQRLRARAGWFKSRLELLRREITFASKQETPPSADWQEKKQAELEEIHREMADIAARIRFQDWRWTRLQANPDTHDREWETARSATRLSIDEIAELLGRDPHEVEMAVSLGRDAAGEVSAAQKLAVASVLPTLDGANQQILAGRWKRQKTEAIALTLGLARETVSRQFHGRIRPALLAEAQRQLEILSDSLTPEGVYRQRMAAAAGFVGPILALDNPAARGLVNRSGARGSAGVVEDKVRKLSEQFKDNRKTR